MPFQVNWGWRNSWLNLKIKGCLLLLFKQQFSIFKHYTFFYIFFNIINITRNILLGLKWLKIAFHLEPSFSLVLIWMQHTRQIINRKVNRSQSIANTTYLSILCLLSLIYELAGEFFNQKKKKNLLENNKVQFWSFIKVQIGLWVSYSHSHHSLSLSITRLIVW